MPPVDRRKPPFHAHGTRALELRARRGTWWSQEAGAPAADVRAHADVIGHEIRRLDGVVQGFLKFARPEDMRIERIQLAELAAEIARTVGPEAQACKVSVTAVCEDPTLTVDADSSMLRQALMKLWGLPELLVRLSDERHADHPAVRSVVLPGDETQVVAWVGRGVPWVRVNTS